MKLKKKKKQTFSPFSNLFVENPSGDLSPRANPRGAEKKHTFSASDLPRRPDCQRRKSDGCAAGEGGEQLPFTFQPVGHKKKMRKS